MTRFVRQTLAWMLSCALLTLAIMAGTLIKPGYAIASTQTPMPGNLLPPQAAPTQPANGLMPQTSYNLFLPVIARNYFFTSETIAVDGFARVYQLLGGRLTLTFPNNAVYGPRELTVTSTSSLGPGEVMHLEFTLYNRYSGQIETGLYAPVAIQFNYAGLDLSFIPESDLAVTSYSSVLTTTLDTVKHTATASTQHLSPFSLSWPGMQLVGASGMAAGKDGSIYVLVPPILYQIPSGSTTLVKRANLREIAPPGATWGSDSKLAYNPTNDSLYLTIGSHSVVYALEGNTLRAIYTTPNPGETVEALAYRRSDHSLFVATSVDAGWWGRSGRILQIDPATGTLLSIYQDSGGFINDIAVNTSGKVAQSSKWTCANFDADNDPYDVNGQTYIGARFLASDGQDNIYVANSGGNAISILSGPSLTLSGIIRVSHPTALAVAGGRILVVSDGRILEIPAGKRDPTGGGAVLVPGDTLSGKGAIITVQGSALERIPAHNVLTYNGHPLEKPPITSCDLKSQPQVYQYVLQPYLLDPLPYIPVNAQKAHLAFSIGGALKAEADVDAPEMPLRGISLSNSPIITLTRGQWVKWDTAVESLDGLFPSQGAGGLYQFRSYGTFHFKLTGGGETKNLDIGIAPFSAPETNSAQIQSAIGGVVWASGAALEIPAGALPNYGGVYTVTFSSTPYANLSRDNPTDPSPLYNFSFSPEPSHLDKAILLHLPFREGSSEQPKVAFYDPLTQDAIALDSQADTTPGYLLFTIPAGNYPPAMGETSSPPGDGLIQAPDRPAVPKPSLFRRSLNWLGSTGLWHAVGLPNMNLQTDNFQVLFNTKDCSESYAQTLLDALEKTLIEFTNRGYQIPSTQVIVKIAPWVASRSTPGVTPGIGSLYNYYMFINNQLSTEDLQDTAAHEYFHVLQKENATVAGRYQNPVWFEEATATWAQYVVYPSHQGYFPDALAGMDFPNIPFSQWDTLDYQQQYAAMSLAVYLEKEAGQEAVLRVMNNLGTMANIQDALDQVTGGWAIFYGKFAKDYWLQKFSPVDQWAAVGAGAMPLKFTQASNTMDIGAPALSSGIIKGYWDATTTPTPPASFTQGVDSAAYLQNATSCDAREVWIFDKTKTIKGSFIGTVAPDFGQPLKKLGDYVSGDPIYFLYINYTGGSSNNSCGFRLVVDDPTITSLSPQAVKVNQSSQITISGAGFGTKMGGVYAGGVTYTPTDWGPGGVIFTLPGQPTQGTISVRVQLPTGALSNPMTLTLTP